MLQCGGVELVLVRLVSSSADQVPFSGRVAKVLMMKTYFEVSTLCELLATSLKSASKGLDLRMYNLVGSYIASLSKLFSANIT